MLRALEADLTSGKTREKKLFDEYSTYLGGRGLAVKLLSDLVEPEVKPLSSQNRLIFSTGALINSRIPMSGRSNATSFSPLTNTVLSSNAGGMFGHNLSSTGYDVLIISGQAAEPQYLILSEEPSLIMADEVWGMDVFQTTEHLMDKHGVNEGSIACIGPAAENLNRCANIMVQRHRAFGRGGLGAILGYKRMKAVVFHGKQDRYDTSHKELGARLRRKIAGIKSKLKNQGTSGVVNTANRNEAMPTRYFSTSQFEHAENINGNKLEELKVKSGTCYSCPVACKMITRSERYGMVTDGPEYETIVFQGSNLGISDLEDIIRSNHLCDKFGLDTISSGNTIGALIEAVKKGKLEHNISWGQGQKVHDVLEAMAANRGIGRELANGTNAFCEKHGIEAVTVKGLDVPGHDPRALHGQALSYAVSNRGADHLYSNTYRDEYDHELRREIRGKAKLVIKNENLDSVLDSLGICKFSTSFYKDEDYQDILGAHLGRTVSWDELQSIGSRVVDMERHLNNQRGFDINNDMLPERLSVPNFEKELQEYYRLRGYSKDGIVQL